MAYWLAEWGPPPNGFQGVVHLKDLDEILPEGDLIFFLHFARDVAAWGIPAALKILTPRELRFLRVILMRLESPDSGKADTA